MNFSHQSPTWLALGDSYTIGEGVAPDERWPTQLAHRHDFALPDYLAKTGWTTVDLLEAIEHADEHAELSEKYDWVSVLIGVNDQYDGLSIEQFRRGFNQILDFAVGKAATPRRVIVLTIPDYSVTPFVKDSKPEVIAQAVAQFNAVISDTVRTKSVRYCDITALSQRAAHDAALLVADGLHPSGEMYQTWAEKVTYDIILPDSESAR